MRKIRLAIIVLACIASSAASDLPASFQQAVDLAKTQQNLPGVKEYSRDRLRPYWQRKMDTIFQACYKTVDHPDPSGFAFVAAIDADGRVLRVYANHETNLGQCVLIAVKAEQFPAPPESPYYFQVNMQSAAPPLQSASDEFHHVADLADAEDELPGNSEYSSQALMPFWRQKYGPVLQGCIKSVKKPDSRRFAFIAIIGRDGKVMRVFVDRDTNLYQCLFATLKAEQFPAPPTPPYFMHIQLQFDMNESPPAK
jgi:hypothetical protein